MNRFDHATIKPEAFCHIDDYVDNFSKIEDVVSDKLYGVRNTDDMLYLSVVIPTFNRRILFREALESVLIQQPVDYKWEILVVDNTPLDKDGCTPALDEIRKFGDTRVCYFHNRENINSGYNWNRGVELARGEWICFLHDDDVLCPDALRNIGQQLHRYRSKKPLGYLHARRINFSGTFEVNTSKSFSQERLTRFGMLLSGCTGAGAPTCGTVIRKKAYFEAGGINYDYGLSADAVLCYQIMINYSVICSNRILGGCRWGDNETLKKSTLLHLIQSDEMLSLFTYRATPFASWWGRVFGAASSWRNIYRKQQVADQNKVKVTKDEFQNVTFYSEPGKIKKMLFLGIYALYRVWRLTDGWIHVTRWFTCK